MHLRTKRRVFFVSPRWFQIGSYGSSNLDKDLTVLKADEIATGNIGCMLQIVPAIEVPVVHTVELLNWGMGGLAPDMILKKLDKY